MRAAAFAFAAACGKITFAGGGNAGFERVFAKTDSPKNPPIPDGKRPSGGLDYFRLDGDPDGVLLKFPKFAGKLKNHKNPKLKLCFGNALENRDSFSLFARSAKDGRILARLNLVNLFGFEPVRFDSPLEDAGEIERYGIVVTYARLERKDAKFISKGDPVCLFAESAAEKLDAHAPHLLLYGEGFDPKAAFRKNFLSLNCILPFGWMSGCQTEGLRELAESGDAEAQTVLAGFLFNGVGVPADKARAAKLWESAAAHGIAFAAKNLAKMYLFGDGVKKDPAQFAKWTKAAADLGDAESMYNISIAYKNGDGVEKSPEEAEYYMKKFKAASAR